MARFEQPEARDAAGRRKSTARERLPLPEDVFLAWLLALPEGMDLAQAARREIARLDAAAPLGPGPARLRGLFIEAATAAAANAPGATSPDR